MPFAFPAPIKPTYAPPLTYPSNLVADNRNYFTRISFKTYKPAYGADALALAGAGITSVVGPFFGPAGFVSVFDSEPVLDPVGSIGEFLGEGLYSFGETLESYGAAIPGSTITLPIPKKVNEMNMMNWSEISLTGTILGAVSSLAFGPRDFAARSTVSGAFQIGSAFAGVQLNPFILQYFQRPSFREFSFTWTLAPRNEKESLEIHKIINTLKSAQAPSQIAGGALMGYPDLAVVQFYPIDQFQITLKDCIIIGINVDYTPAGPSYVNGTSAPSMVNLTLHLKETKLWWSEEWEAIKNNNIAPGGAAGFEARAGGGVAPFIPEIEIE